MSKDKRVDQKPLRIESTPETASAMENLFWLMEDGGGSLSGEVQYSVDSDGNRIITVSPENDDEVYEDAEDFWDLQVEVLTQDD